MSDQERKPNTLEAILDCDDVEVVEVKVPEWGRTVHVRTLGGDQRDEIDLAFQERRKAEEPLHIRATYVAASLCDPDGTPWQATRSQVERLGRKSGAALDRVFKVVVKISGLSSEEIDELEKN